MSNDAEIMTDSLTEQEVRLNKLSTLKENGINPYPYNFNKTHHIHELISKYKSLTSDDQCEDSVSFSGRIMAKRGHGKATFGNVMDQGGTIQYYANINVLGEASYSRLLSLDVGDFIGITGTPFCSKRGELSIKIQSYELLTKSLHPLPEKYHGLQDKELRYRQRYVDLIMNATKRLMLRAVHTSVDSR